MGYYFQEYYSNRSDSNDYNNENDGMKPVPAQATTAAAAAATKTAEEKLECDPKIPKES
jgi:hypothetical protein